MQLQLSVTWRRRDDGLFLLRKLFDTLLPLALTDGSAGQVCEIFTTDAIIAMMLAAPTLIKFRALYKYSMLAPL